MKHAKLANGSASKLPIGRSRSVAEREQLDRRGRLMSWSERRPSRQRINVRVRSGRMWLARRSQTADLPLLRRRRPCSESHQAAGSPMPQLFQ
jgi:hypothetical protein